MKRGLDLIVFDWDGTLMDSTQKICACIGRAARDCDLPDPGPEQSRQIIGLGLSEALGTLFPDASPRICTDLALRYRHYYLGADATPTPLFAGVRDGLAALQAAGYTLAVATGKSRKGLERAFIESDTIQFFSASRCADECRSKPHALMLEELLAVTGVPRERAVMVGDTTFDLQMAQNARMAGLGVTYGAHTLEQLMDVASLGYVPSFQEVLRWFL